MKLEVWIEALDRPIGTLDRDEDKSLSFTYAPDLPPQARISLALPIREAPYGDAACVAFFGNLLLEGRELERVMAAHRIDRDDIGALLFHLGADSPGAISITPEGHGPGKRPGHLAEDYDEVEAAAVARIVTSLHTQGRLPDGAMDPSPIAGVQPKIALLHHDGRFYLPKPGSGAPTTHILKVSPREDSDLTRHEVALLSLARRLGLDVTDCSAMTFPRPDTGGAIHALLTRRFDRTIDGPLIRRLHSEDFAQAAGLARHLKYERDAATPDHRFSAQAIGRIAKQMAAPALFQMEILRHTLFSLAVGNTDNHAKNGSILYTASAGRLAPLYDVVPVTMDPKVSHEFSFLHGKAAFAEDLSIVDLEQTMRDLGFARPKFTGPWVKIFTDVAAGLDQLSREGGKSLADAVAAQLSVVEQALGMKFGLPARDYFPRVTRDERPVGGGWGAFS